MMHSLGEVVQSDIYAISLSAFPEVCDRSWRQAVPGESFVHLPRLAQTVKNPPAVREPWVPSLWWEDPLEEEMAAQSSILAWRIPWTEEPGGLYSIGSQSQTWLKQLSTNA